MEFYGIAYNFLKLSGFSVSLNYLRERLEAHPDYPSLISITDILDEFKIENHAMRIEDKEKWVDLRLPFIAHIVSENGLTDFQLITKAHKAEQQEAFLAKWTGIVLLLGEKSKITHKEHNEVYKKERFQKTVSWSLIIVSLLLLLTYQVVRFELATFIHFILSIIGLGISSIIIAHSMGLKTNVGELFCKIEESGCNKVLNSRLGRIMGDIGLGDIGAIFFGSQLIYVSISTSLDVVHNLTFLALIQALALVFTPISLLYQWRLKSWCRLCLVVILVIWVQAINLIWSFPKGGLFSINSISLTFESFLLFVISLSFASFWILVKPFKLKEQTSFYQRIRIRKWRQDPAWFNALLPLHKRIDDSIWEKEIFYGNPKGVLQIMVVSNPYCEYCAKAHFELDAILEKHPKDIGVRVRFSIKTTHQDDEKYKALFQILSAYEQLVWNEQSTDNNQLMKSIITDWYKTQDLALWKEKYGHRNENPNMINTLIRRAIDWSSQMGIHQTPAFFINGHEMPNPHTFQDLFLFIDDYIQILKNNSIPSIAKIKDSSN